MKLRPELTNIPRKIGPKSIYEIEATLILCDGVCEIKTSKIIDDDIDTMTAGSSKDQGSTGVTQKGHIKEATPSSEVKIVEFDHSPKRPGTRSITDESETKRSLQDNCSDTVEEKNVIVNGDVPSTNKSGTDSISTSFSQEITKSRNNCEDKVEGKSEVGNSDSVKNVDADAASPHGPQDGSGGNGDVKVTEIVTRSSGRQKHDSVSAGAAKAKQLLRHTWEGWCSPHKQSSEGAMTSEGGDAVAPTATDDQEHQTVSSPCQQNKLKSILKNNRLMLNKKSTKRITFNDMMTVFSDSLGTSFVAMSSDAVIPEDIYVAYEPPPEYQDCVDFEPPDEYKDDRFETVHEEKEEEACSDGTVEAYQVTSFCVEEPVETSLDDGAGEKLGCDSNDKTLTDEHILGKSQQHVKNALSDSVMLPDIHSESVPQQLQEEEVGEEDDEKMQPRVNSLLTEENLKQHEQMMKQGVVTSRSDQPLIPPPLPTTPPPASPPPPAAPRKASAKVTEELSPPLKQLSVQVVNEPPPPGDDWQIELSPLNSGSTQETESDSSLSSQDTIIMMTSDESKRNEEHIKESMRIYEGIKKTDSSSLSSSGSDETKSSTMDSETPSSDSHTTSSSGGTTEGWTSNDIRRVIERNAMRRSMQRYTETRKKVQTEPTKQTSTSLTERIKQLTCVDNDTDSGVDSERSSSDSSSSSSSLLGNTYQASNQPDVSSQCANRIRRIEGLAPGSGTLTSLQRHSLAYHGYISPLGGISSPPCFSKLTIHRSASEMNVPSSYNPPRQQLPWERHHNGPENPHQGVARCLSANDESHFDKSICDTSTISKLGIESNRFNSKLTEGGVDELELFVKQDSDRIDRIRQRYSYSSGVDSGLEVSPDLLIRKPSVRGIKTKFGSTTEILQQMQTQIQPPIYASPKNVGSHMTWPYNTNALSRSNTQISSHHPQMPSSQSSGVLQSVCEHPTGYRSQRGLEILEVVVVNKDERGAPEGASSSPKVFSDPLWPTLQKPAEERNVQADDGVIFYSMNV